jgi:hypothetical protein
MNSSALKGAAFRPSGNPQMSTALAAEGLPRTAFIEAVRKSS